MEVDWRQGYIDAYYMEGSHILALLQQRSVEEQLLQQIFRFVIGYLQVPREKTNPQADEVIVQVAQAIYNQFQRLGHWNQITVWWPQLRMIAAQLVNPDLEVEIIRQLAIIKNNQGQAKEAQHLYEQLVYSPKFADLPLKKQADVLHQLGVCYFGQGSYNQSETIFLRGRNIAVNQNLWEMEAYILNMVGNIALYKGNMNRAVSYFQQSLALFEANGQADGLARVAYHGLGRIHLYQKNLTLAITLLEKSLSISRRVQEVEGTINTALYLALAYIEIDEFIEAEALLDEALHGYKQTHETAINILYSFVMGRLSARQGQVQAAIDHWSQALVMLEKTPIPPLEQVVLAVLIPYLLKKGYIRLFYNRLRRLFYHLQKYDIGLFDILRFCYQGRYFWSVNAAFNHRPGLATNTPAKKPNTLSR